MVVMRELPARFNCKRTTVAFQLLLTGRCAAANIRRRPTMCEVLSCRRSGEVRSMLRGHPGGTRPELPKSRKGRC